jgi:hypothetical protein
MTRHRWSIVCAVVVLAGLCHVIYGVVRFSKASCMWAFFFTVSCNVEAFFAPHVPLIVGVGLVSLFWLWKDRGTTRVRARVAVAAFVTLIVATHIFIALAAGGGPVHSP